MDCCNFANIVQLVFGLAILQPRKKLGETFQAESNVMNYKILIPGRASFTYDWLWPLLKFWSPSKVKLDHYLKKTILRLFNSMLFFVYWINKLLEILNKIAIDQKYKKKLNPSLQSQPI